MKMILNILTILSMAIVAHCQIFAIDFGTEYIKAAVVNKGSGKAFSIVETPKSQRKFINSIGFYSEQRFYQSQSIPKRTRYPKNCFIFNKLLIDSVLYPELVSTIKKDLLLQYITKDMGDPLLAEFTLQNFPAETSKVTLIQVVAMIIKYARSNAEKQIKQQIKDVVITVPSYWNVKMRAFIIEAAQIADLHVLSLISQNSAAAINYALNQRTKNTTETILFYNLGSNALQISLIQFKAVPQQKSKPVQSIFVLSDYSKNYVGGLKFDSLLFSFFKKRFETKYKKQLSIRGAIKLWGEVSQVKQVLSANKDSPLYVQGIMDGIDYHDKVTRVEFQQMIEPILKEITTPIKRFLFDNNLRPEDLDSVQMIGGSSRIPKLQSLISDIIGNSSKVGTHINADEAMVLGAAFYGANSSKKFKVKGVNLNDGFNFEVRAVLKNLEDGISQGDQRYFYRNVTVFNKKSRFGLSKQLNFKCKQNIILQLYKQDETGSELLRSDKLDNIKDVNETDFKVSITLVLNPIEIVEVKKAQIKYKKDELTTYMEKVKKQKSTTKGEQKQQKQDKKQQTDEKQQEKEVQDNQVANKQQEQKKQEQVEEQQNEGKQGQKDNLDEQEEQADEQDDKQTKQQKQESKDEKTNQDDKKNESKQKKKTQKKKKAKEPKQQYETVERSKIVTKKYEKDLHIQQTFSREKADHDSMQKSRKMLKDYEKAEDERKKLAESKNKLQALIYEIKHKLDNQEFMQYVQTQQKINLQQLMKQKQQWLDETSTNNKHDYDEQSKALLKPLDRIKKRIHEYQSREVHYKKVLHAIKEYRDLSLNITKKKQWITSSEVDGLLSKLDEWKSEVEDMYEKMEDTAQNQNCVFQIKDMEKVVDKAKDEYFKVMATPKPSKKQKKQQTKQKQEKSADQSEQL